MMRAPPVSAGGSQSSLIVVDPVGVTVKFITSLGSVMPTVVSDLASDTRPVPAWLRAKTR